jgi:hypothetical protein
MAKSWAGLAVGKPKKEKIQPMVGSSQEGKPTKRLKEFGILKEDY